MPDPRRYYIDHDYTCPECRGALRFERRSDKSDSMILVHDGAAFVPCSRAGKMYYAPVLELQPFSYELVVGPLTQATPGPPATHLCPHDIPADETCKACGRLGVVDGAAAAAPPAVQTVCPCASCRKARADAEKRATIAANLRPPFETFKRATCKGSYVFGSACGMCERCTWERSQMGFKS